VEQSSNHAAPVQETATGSQAEQALVDECKVRKGSRQNGVGTLGKYLAERGFRGGRGQPRLLKNSAFQLSRTRGIRLFN